ncbi:MAG: 4'-phosphopantetheinyl transferase superfamily protein [Alphaproteobacteria bacterium]
MSGGLPVLVWTMRVGGLDEAAVAAWLELLDDAERRRAARFAFARHRIEFIAAHALLRVALASELGAPPRAWDFVPGAHGKPVAWVGGAPAPLSFNLSHTAGMVGLAAAAVPGREIGFDLENLGRKVDLKVADRYFTPPEVAWIAALPEPERSRGFLRLWTLKEAFIKATGKGLTQNLASFWFAPMPPRIHFSPELGEDSADWRFEQRVLDGAFIGALGVRHRGPIAVRWIAIDPARLGGDGLCAAAAAARDLG